LYVFCELTFEQDANRSLLLPEEELAIRNQLTEKIKISNILKIIYKLNMLNFFMAKILLKGLSHKFNQSVFEMSERTWRS